MAVILLMRRKTITAYSSLHFVNTAYGSLHFVNTADGSLHFVNTAYGSRFVVPVSDIWFRTSVFFFNNRKSMFLASIVIIQHCLLK